MTYTQQQLQTLAQLGLLPNQQQPQQPQAQPQQPAPAVPFSVVANPAQFPTPPFAQPTTPQYPQQPGQQTQNQQTQPQQPANLLTQRIPAGANVPAAFVGRTVEEIIAGFARTAAQLQTMQRNGTPAPQAQQQTNPQQPSTFTQATQQQQPQQQQTPAGITLEDIQQTVQQTLTQMNLPSLILQVEQSVAQQVPQYQIPAVQQKVKEMMQTLPPEQQANRNAWDYAVKIAVGELTLNGQLQPQGMPGFVAPSMMNAPYSPPVGSRPQLTDQSMQLPPQSGFVEQPSGFVGMNGRPALTNAEAMVAKNLGLNPSEVATYNQQTFSGIV